MKTETDYFKYAENTNSWTMFTTDQTLAGLISFENENEKNVDDYLRIMFLSYEMTDGTVVEKWYGSKPCNEIYQNETEVSDSKWICPDVDNIEVLNNPNIYKKRNGNSFSLVVVECTTAKEIVE